MSKLKLDVDALQVDTFATDAQPKQTGTVHGRLNNDPGDSTDCDGDGFWSLFGTCAGCPTVGTCIGPTYCCAPTWRSTCNPSGNESCTTSPCPDW